MTVVNWDSWNKLPAEYQEIIESVSLRDGSIDVAEAFRQDAQASCEAALEKGGQLTEVSEEFKAELTEAAEGIVEQWISDHSTDSFDASSYYDHFIEYLEQEAD